MPLLTVLAINAAVSAVAFLALWLISLRLKDVSFIDAWWGPGMALLACSTVETTGDGADVGVVGDQAAADDDSSYQPSGPLPASHRAPETSEAEPVEVILLRCPGLHEVIGGGRHRGRIVWIVVGEHVLEAEEVADLVHGYQVIQ